MNWICLAMVIVAYALGHTGGYRKCKLRARNLVKKYIQSQGRFPPPVESLLAEVVAL